MRYNQFRRMMYRLIVVGVVSIFMFLAFFQDHVGHHSDQPDTSLPRQPVSIPFADNGNLNRPDKRVHLSFFDYP